MWANGRAWLVKALTRASVDLRVQISHGVGVFFILASKGREHFLFPFKKMERKICNISIVMINPRLRDKYRSPADKLHYTSNNFRVLFYLVIRLQLYSFYIIIKKLCGIDILEILLRSFASFTHIIIMSFR